MKKITDHPDFNPKDFEKNCCRGTGLVEINGEVESCPVCEALLEKYKGYGENEAKEKSIDYGGEIPF